MSPSHVIEPTYAAIKARLMEAYWPAGMRLETARLADDLSVSITPVRDSLNRLTGERLVAFRPGEGFRVPRLADHELADLLGCHEQILLVALRSRSVDVPPFMPEQMPDVANRAERLFAYLGRSTGNDEIAAIIASLGDRLHAARRSEAGFLDGLGDEVAALEEAAGAGDHGPADLPHLIVAYHARRAAQVERYVRYLDHTAR